MAVDTKASGKQLKGEGMIGLICRFFWRFFFGNFIGSLNVDLCFRLNMIRFKRYFLLFGLPL